MREKGTRPGGGVRRLLLAVAVLCVVLVATSSVLPAAEITPAPKAKATSASARPVTIFDPFALRAIVPSAGDPGVKATSMVFVRPGTRNVVRMPVRPAPRSAFRPDW